MSLFCVYNFGAKHPEIIYQTTSLFEARHVLDCHQNCEKAMLWAFPEDWTNASIYREKTVITDNKLFTSVDIVKKISGPQEFLDYCRAEGFSALDLVEGFKHDDNSSIKVSIIFDTLSKEDMAKRLAELVRRNKEYGRKRS